MLHVYAFWHVLRWFVMVLSIVAMMGVVLEARQFWKPVYCNKERMTLVAFFIVAFTLGYTAFENNLEHNPGGFRIILQIISAGFIITRNTMQLRRIQINTGKTNAESWHDWLVEENDGAGAGEEVDEQARTGRDPGATAV